MNRIPRIVALLVSLFALAALIAPVASAGGSGGALLITNNGFETGLSPWTIVNKTGDKIVCGSKAPSGITGNCAFMFRGSTAEAAVLTQKVTGLAPYNALLADNDGWIMLNYDYFSHFDASSLSANLNVNYHVPGDKTYKIKSAALAWGSTLVWTEQGLEFPVVVPQGAIIKKIAVKFKNLSTSGKLYIDDVALLYYNEPLGF